MPAKRYPLPKRFNVALSEKAYENLRLLNEEYQYGNNYLLTILLENLDQVVKPDAMQQAFADFKAVYRAPKGTMKSKKQ